MAQSLADRHLRVCAIYSETGVFTHQPSTRPLSHPAIPSIPSTEAQHQQEVKELIVAAAQEVNLLPRPDDLGRAQKTSGPGKEDANDEARSRDRGEMMKQVGWRREGGSCSFLFCWGYCFAFSVSIFFGGSG